MKLLKHIVVFLIINFGALAIGTWLMADGPQKAWYLNLNKAPWTPAGWVFGAAWSTIMLFFSIYMAYLYQLLPTQKILKLFGVQFVFNVGWNYVFFNQHLITVGLIVIVALTGIIALFINNYRKQMRYKTLLILPYLIWLCIATSLNLYILIHN